MDSGLVAHVYDVKYLDRWGKNIEFTVSLDNSAPKKVYLVPEVKNKNKLCLPIEKGIK